MKLRQENRIVVVHGSKKICELWNIVIKESIQDNGKTLKIFINPDEKVKDINSEKDEK